MLLSDPPGRDWRRFIRRSCGFYRSPISTRDSTRSRWSVTSGPSRRAFYFSCWNSFSVKDGGHGRGEPGSSRRHDEGRPWRLRRFWLSGFCPLSRWRKRRPIPERSTIPERKPTAREISRRPRRTCRRDWARRTISRCSSAAITISETRATGSARRLPRKIPRQRSRNGNPQ